MTSVPCPRCVKGSWEGPNGMWFRCAFCRGTGKVAKPCGGTGVASGEERPR